MLNPEWWGLGLLWLSVLVLVVIIAIRAKNGAWSETAFDDPPAVGWGMKSLALCAFLCAILGGILAFRTL